MYDTKLTKKNDTLVALENLFGLRARMLWSDAALAVVYGAYLEAALTRPYEVTEDGVIVLDNMRDIISRTGLGRSTGTVAKLTRKLEALGLLNIISMTNDSRDSMIMVMTRPFLSELPQSFLSEKDFLGATNKEQTQPFLTEAGTSTPFFFSEVRLTQSFLKESILPIFLDNELVTKDKDIVTNNKYFYTSTYLLLWGRNESILGYQLLSINQKVVLELVCNHEFDVDSLAIYLGVRKNNLKSRILKPLEDYVRIENGIVTPRENLLEVLEGGFDRGRFENIRRTIKGGRSDFREQQREHMGEEDRRTMDLFEDFLDLRRRRKGARAPNAGTASVPEGANHNSNGHESDRVTAEEAIAALDSLDLPDCEHAPESGEPEAAAPEPETGVQNQSEETYFDGLCGEIDALGFKGRGTGVTKEVARVLFENPETLRQEFIGSVWVAAKEADESMNATPADFERALEALHHKTSFGAFADEQREATCDPSIETATIPNRGSGVDALFDKAALSERLAWEHPAKLCDKCDVRFAATSHNTTGLLTLCDNCLVSYANGWN